MCVHTPLSFHLSVGMPMIHCLYTSLSKQARDTICIYISPWASLLYTVIIHIHPSLSFRAILLWACDVLGLETNKILYCHYARCSTLSALPGVFPSSASIKQ